ncbi:MAG: hypothetical protein HYV40_04175 [Candidatus Levybacteria bacterium]|nr:hypothetical protein [Candidatus Levybacteria bacterium]
MESTSHEPHLENQLYIGSTLLNANLLEELADKQDPFLTVIGRDNKTTYKIGTVEWTSSDGVIHISVVVENKSQTRRFGAIWHSFRDGLPNVVSFDILTRDVKSGRRSGELRAGKLVDIALDFFQRINPVERLLFGWNGSLTSRGSTEPASDNFVQFQESGDPFTTWTGVRIARRHGFTELGQLRRYTTTKGREVVDGYFIKPGLDKSFRLTDSH